ncbi:MAG TPA: tautomerase family protein [Clostridiales bacterium]|nr:tautomerase family protein [Clostridiales bacterium]
MPIVNVAMLKGRSPEYKKTVLNCIHQGLVDAIGIEDWDRFQRITEYDREDFEIPSFKTDAFMIIEMKLFPGRTKEQKKDLIENITGALKERLSVDPSDVFIVIQEPPLENWGIGGKQKRMVES